MGSRHVLSEAAEQRVTGALEQLSDQIPDREIDSAACDVVTCYPSAALRDEFDTQRIDPDQRIVQPTTDGINDRRLRLAIGIRSRLRLSLPDDAGVRVDPYENVVRVGDASRGELWPTPIRHHVRDRFEGGDADSAHERMERCERHRLGLNFHRRRINSLRPRSGRDR